MVLNTKTGAITPAFHVVIDDSFSTVPSIGREEDPPDHWEDLCLDSAVSIPVKDGIDKVDPTWITTAEQQAERRQEVRSSTIRQSLRSHIEGEQQQQRQLSLIHI